MRRCSLFFSRRKLPPHSMRKFSATSPSCEPLLDKAEDCATILTNQLHPSQAAHLRKVNSAKAKSCNEDVYALVERLVSNRTVSFRQCLWAVGIGPRVIHLRVSFCDCHL